MQTHNGNPQTGANPESALDELIGTLWAISVITRRMAGQINTLRQMKGDTKNEQNVGTIHYCCRTAQIW